MDARLQVHSNLHFTGRAQQQRAPARDFVLVTVGAVRRLVGTLAVTAAPHSMLYLRAAAAWLLILLLAILNGGLREAVLFPQLGNPAAQLISGALLIGCILGVSYLLVPRLGAVSRPQLVGVGVLWLVLTLVFEFGFGVLVQGKSWHELLAAYAFHDGNIWPIVLLVTVAAPFLVGRR